MAGRLRTARWGLLLVVAIALTCCGEDMRRDPRRFSFEYFDSLPRNEIVSAAQAYLDRRFPVGSDLHAVKSELISAGAKCGRGIGQRGVYCECDYEKRGPWPLSTLEWKIILRPDQDEKAIVKIEVNRGVTGL